MGWEILAWRFINGLPPWIPLGMQWMLKLRSCLLTLFFFCRGLCLYSHRLHWVR
jgi:hypothetical protein